jgi:hypothetical protein
LLGAGIAGMAQAPIITTANNFAVGELNVQYAADTVGIDHGASGANVTWDFTNLKRKSTNDSSISKFQTVASTPYPNDFPTADLATKSLSSKSYLYLSYKNSTYTIVGFEGEQTQNGQTVVIKQIYDKPEVLYTFPLTYNTVQHSDYAAHYDVQGNTTFRRGTLDVKGDAYGTLKIMNKTFTNVLRIHALTNETDSFSSFPLTINFVTESWSYVAVGKKDPILTIMYSSAGGSSSKSVTYNINSSTLAVEEPAEDQSISRIFPNPAHQNCRMSFTAQSEGRTDVRIINQLGQEVKVINNLQVHNGENTIDLDLNGISKGMYYIRLNSTAQKLIVE